MLEQLKQLKDTEIKRDQLSERLEDINERIKNRIMEQASIDEERLYSDEERPASVVSDVVRSIVFDGNSREVVNRFKSHFESQKIISEQFEEANKNNLKARLNILENLPENNNGLIEIDVLKMNEQVVASKPHKIVENLKELFENSGVDYIKEGRCFMIKADEHETPKETINALLKNEGGGQKAYSHLKAGLNNDCARFAGERETHVVAYKDKLFNVDNMKDANLDFEKRPTSRMKNR